MRNDEGLRTAETSRLPLITGNIQYNIGNTLTSSTSFRMQVFSFIMHMTEKAVQSFSQ